MLQRLLYKTKSMHKDIYWHYSHILMNGFLISNLKNAEFPLEFHNMRNIWRIKQKLGLFYFR